MTEEQAIERTVLDYFDSWFDGNLHLGRTDEGWKIVNALWDLA
jgi:Putative lumazine-binding